MVLELFDGDVNSIYEEYLKKGRGIPEQLTRKILFQIMLALASLRGENNYEMIQHRDIKPQNLLLVD